MDKKQHARHLFMAGNKTHKQIADKVGISERTVFSWVHQYNWDTLRTAAYQAPVTIADNLCTQIVELQNSIAAREAGKRFPTPQEAETTRKLVNSLDKMKKYPSVSQSMQLLEMFRSFIRPADKDFASRLGNYIEQFLEAKTENGFNPASVEYSADPLGPVSPFYEEIDDKDDESLILCMDTAECLHPGNCTFPQCIRKKKPDRHITPHIHAENADNEFIEPAEIPATVSFIEAAQPTVNEAISAENQINFEVSTSGNSGRNPAISGQPKSSFARPPLKAVIPTTPLSQIPEISPNATAASGSHPAIFISKIVRNNTF